MDAKYKNPDNDVSPWQSSDAFAPGAATHQSMVYAIQHPFTGEMIYPGPNNHWRYSQETMLDIFSGWTDYHLANLNDEQKRAELCELQVEDVRQNVLGLVLSKPLQESREEAQSVMNRGQWPRFYFTKGGLGGVRRKTYLDSVGGALPTNFWPYEVAGHTDKAKKDIREIFDGRVAFDTPKPTQLIERILAIATKPGDIVLDSFAGSGTTGQAVLNLNKKDQGNRSFILIELGDYADTVTAERIKRTIAGYKNQQVETKVLFDQKITTAALKKGQEVFEEASKIAAEAQGIYTKVSKPKLVATVKGKSASTSLQVIAENHHEQDISGTGGSFSYYELGLPILTGEELNPAVPLEKIREYIWFTETRESYKASKSEIHPDFLGRSAAGVSYFFAYAPEKATTLNRDYLSSISNESFRAESYVIYADICLLSDQELAELNITFKKIPRDITRL